MRRISTTLALLLATGPAFAGNVDLSTLPARATVQLTIYNSEDLTLVRETRRLSFEPGPNQLQFSWQGTRIDPSSVELRFLEHRADLELIDTTFPHDKPHMLYWNVQSERAGDALVEVSYFTSGISWSADYVAITDPKGERLSLESFVRVHNQSGEDYEGAQVRLVVGSLNLVQRIAELAGVSPAMVPQLGDVRRRQLEAKVARRAIEKEEDMLLDAASAGSTTRPKAVQKDSLSEYYLFTVEGTETVPHGWSKRLRSFAAKGVPFAVEHRYRPQQYGDHLERVLVAKNDRASKLGQGPLPDGVVRVFAAQPAGGLAYVGAQSVQYVPIGEELEVRLGADPDVAFELVALSVRRDGFTFHNASVVGWDEHTVYERRIRNFSDRPLRLELRERFTGDATFSSALDVRRHDAQAVVHRARAGSGETLNLRFMISQRLGRRARHQQLDIVRAAVEAPGAR